MNIVIIKLDNADSLSPQNESNAVPGFNSLRTIMGAAGQILVEDVQNRKACFLVATQNLLIALRKAPSLDQLISIRVFSLTSPEEQLLEKGCEDTNLDSWSVDLKSEFPTA